jgi:hypothetical protein
MKANGGSRCIDPHTLYLCTSWIRAVSGQRSARWTHNQSGRRVDVRNLAFTRLELRSQSLLATSNFVAPELECFLRTKGESSSSWFLELRHKRGSITSPGPRDWPPLVEGGCELTQDYKSHVGREMKPQEGFQNMCSPIS